MKKVFLAVLLSLGLSGCTPLESLLIGSLLGGTTASYGKPWLDRYLTPAESAPLTKEEVRKMIEDAVKAKP